LLLDQKDELSYSEIIKLTGIKEPGTLAFHLKKFGNLISKNKKLYVLTKERKVAVAFIKGSSIFKSLRLFFFIFPYRTTMGVLGAICKIIFFFYTLFVGLNLYYTIRVEQSFSSLKVLNIFSEVFGIILGMLIIQQIMYKTFEKLDRYNELNVGIRNLFKNFTSLVYTVLTILFVLSIVSPWIFPASLKLLYYHYYRGFIASSILGGPVFLNLYELKFQSKISINIVKNKIIVKLQEVFKE